jgi:hypothetical protein
MIDLSIYSLDGKFVENLVNGIREIGSHSTTWDSKNNPTGIYIARLTTKNEGLSRKLLLIK